jgi:competence protein ComEC
MQLPLQALAFTAGIAWVATRSTLELATVGVALIFCALLAIGRARPIAVAFAAGVAWACLRAWSLLPDPLPAHLSSTDLVLVGDIVSLPEVQGARTQFDFEPRGVRLAGLPARIRLSWFQHEPAPRAGERWQLTVRLRAPRGFANPGGYDYEGELFRAGIGATGYVRDNAINQRQSVRTARYPVLTLRAGIARRIERTLEGSPATGVISGLAVGASQGITPGQWRVFAATGTTHLIAISGLHITMVAALAMLLAQALWRLPRAGTPRSSRPDVTCLCGALAALAYAALAGFSVPTQRTLVMLLCALSATWLRRSQPPANVLALALIAVLVYDPHAVLTAGLWLSFVAVAAIILGVGSLLGRPRPLCAFLSTQGAVSVALLPATALLFGSVSLVAPIANLFAIPLFSALLVPGTLLGVALMLPFPALGELLLHLVARLCELSWPAFEWTAALPGALVHFATPGLRQALLMSVSAAVLMSPLPVWLRAPGWLLFAAMVSSNPARPAAGAFTATTLDVGEGLSVVVRTRSHALLYDTGPAFRSGRSAGELVIAPYLHAQGISQLDMLVTSHADDDHAGGAAAVEEALVVATARHGGMPRRALRAPSSACNQGEAWIWDGVRFEFLHPRAGEQWSDNDGSCVLAVSAGATRVLLTGDIELEAERRLLERSGLARAAIVIVPHHGSRSSSSEALVRRLQARWAIVSAGAGNRWGFPHEPVVRRWCEAGAEVIDTAEWGAITIVVNATGAVTPPRSHRREHRRYWHARSAGTDRSRSLCAVQYHPPQLVTIYH